MTVPYIRGCIMNGYEIEYHTGIGSALANKYVVKLSDILVRSKRQSKQPENVMIYLVVCFLDLCNEHQFCFST